MEPTEILGVDIGGVILDFIPYFGTELDHQGVNYLNTPEIEDAIDSIAFLNKGRFKDRVFVVSKVEKIYGPGRKKIHTRGIANAWAYQGVLSGKTSPLRSRLGQRIGPNEPSSAMPDPDLP